ncbi:MAG: PDZ domain-containing protein [Planctomycetota bacterium]
MTRTLTLLLTALISCGAAVAQNPLAHPATPGAPYAGQFTGDRIALDLDFDAAAARYAGTLTFEGQDYACSGEVRDGELRGNFDVGGQPYAFAATRSGDTVTLTSDGNSYTLTKKATPPQTPTDRAPATSRSGADTPTPPHSDPSGGDSQAQGGVGIAFRQNEAGDWVVEQVAPGGPAAKQNIRPGTILRAVDGKSVANLTRDQVRALCIGSIGSVVTLSMETDTEVLDVLVQRGGLGGAPPAPRAAGGPDRPNVDFGAPARAPDTPAVPASVGFPAWMKTGMRITYYSGSASIPGATTSLEEDENGNWMDGQGRHYSPQQLATTAGAGYVQYDLAHVGDDGLAAHMSNFVFADAQLATTVLTHSQGFVGDRNGIGDLWIHPARLAAMQEQQTPTFRVRRLRYPLGGREYDAITTQTKAHNGYWRTTYDLDTGLLLVMSSSSVGRGTFTPNPDGTASEAAGVNTIVNVHLVAVRELNLPWAGAGMPSWLRAGQVLRYRGSCRNSLGEGVVAPWAFESQIAVQRVGPGFATAKLTTSLDYGTGAAPQTDTSDRVLGAGMVGGVHLDPAVGHRLQSGQVLDQDPVTKRRTGVVGQDGNYVTIGEEGPLDGTRWTYDLRNGLLVGVAAQQRQGAATITTQVQLTK